MYEGACNCGWNVTTSSDENCGISNDSEAAEHLYQFREHKFNCKNLRKVLSKVRKRKIHKSILRNMFILYPKQSGRVSLYITFSFIRILSTTR